MLMNFEVRCQDPYNEKTMLVKKWEIPKEREQRRELARLVNMPEGMKISR
jgi:hypothetical protein